MKKKKVHKYLVSIMKSVSDDEKRKEMKSKTSNRPSQ